MCKTTEPRSVTVSRQAPWLLALHPLNKTPFLIRFLGGIVIYLSEIYHCYKLISFLSEPELLTGMMSVSSELICTVK